MEHLRCWIRRHDVLIPVVFGLLAFGVPLTPFATSTLGYITVALAAIIAVYLGTITILKFSEGIRYVQNEGPHHYSRSEVGIRFFLVANFYLVLLSFAAILFLFNREPKPLAKYLLAWGVSHSSGHVVVDAEVLSPYSPRYKLAVLANRRTGLVDERDDMFIQKSKLFDIRGKHLKIVVPFDDQFTKSPGIVEFTILLVPHGVEMSQFSTLRQILALGAVDISSSAIHSE